MSKKTNLLGTNEEHLEILKGFYKVIIFLKRIGVQQITLSEIEQTVKQTYYKYGSFKFPFKLLPDNILLIDEKKINLYPKGLNAGETPFNLSNVYNSEGFQFDGLTNTLTSTGDPTLMAVGTGLQILDGLGLDFQTNINNVLTYGLDSWGAALNPEKAKIRIETYLNIVNKPINGIKNSTTIHDLEQNLNQLELGSRFYAEMFRASLNRRSWAKSTEAGFKLMDQTFNQFYTETVEPIFNTLKGAGYKFNYKNNSSSFGDLDHIYMPDIKDDSDHTTAEKNGTFTHKVYTIVSVPNTKKNNIQQQETTNNSLLNIAGISMLAWIIVPKILK